MAGLLPVQNCRFVCFRNRWRSESRIHVAQERFVLCVANHARSRSLASAAPTGSGSAADERPAAHHPDRREYNRFVADETLEDYALRFTAKKARRWSGFEVAQTALGSISFLALEAIGGTLVLTEGFVNALAAILVVSLIIFATAAPITTYAARYGVDMDLLTRGPASAISAQR